MGASKRVAELIVESYASESQTHFAIVQFGNVLGSRGSVIPLFQKQILWGGPITITHPDVTRYFMSIPEAVKLVIQTGSMANQGEIFALDMGEPVNITDVARNLITLAGLEPDTDIEITYTGLRPGEKLSEISPTAETGARKTSFPDIFQIPPDKINKDILLSEIASLQKEIDTNSEASPAAVLERLIQLISCSINRNINH